MAQRQVAPAQDSVLRKQAKDAERSLTFSIGDATFGQIVRRQFNPDLITGNDPDEVLAHSPGDMRHHFVSGFQLNTESSVGEGLRNSALYFECFFFLSQLIS